LRGRQLTVQVETLLRIVGIWRWGIDLILMVTMTVSGGSDDIDRHKKEEEDVGFHCTDLIRSR
jgi:hypothetical protein